MYNKINENLFKSWFSTCKKKLLSVISCHCPELAICTDLFNRDTLITPYRKFSLNCKKHSKTEKNMFKLNVFLIRFLPYLYTARIWLNLVTSKAFWSSRSQMFYKIGVLENCAKFMGKHLCWSHFSITLHKCFPMIFVEVSRTPIFQSPLKIKQRFYVDKLAK